MARKPTEVEIAFDLGFCAALKWVAMKSPEGQEVIVPVPLATALEKRRESIHYRPPKPSRRSQEHSNFTHMAIGRYAAAMGMSADKAKIMLKMSYGPWVPYPFRDSVAPKWRGAFVLAYEGTPNERLVFLKSEADYTTREELRLKEGIKAECFDAGVDLDDLFLEDG